MMKTLRNIQCLAVVLCSVATFWSCSDELEHGGTGFSSDAIVFDGGLSEKWNTSGGTRSAADKDSVANRTQKFENAELYLHTSVTPGIEEDSSFAVTRASEITNASITIYSFGVYAYAMRKESEDDTFDPSKAAEYIVNQEVSYNEESSKWTYSPMRFWPASDDYLMQFIGYAPYDAIPIKADKENNTLTIDYTVPEAVADQKDLLVCSIVRESTDRTPVSLHFDHICTAVKFVVGDINGTVHSIALKGVRNKGTFDMNTEEWTLVEDEEAVADFTQSLEKDLGDAPAEGTEITLAPQTFMMLPQTLPDGAQIEVVFTEGEYGIKRTLTANIEGTTWPIDNTVIYKINATELVPVFTVPKTLNVGENGGNPNFTVTSYFQGSTGEQHKVGWKVKRYLRTLYNLDGSIKYEEIKEGDADYPSSWINYIQDSRNDNGKDNWRPHISVKRETVRRTHNDRLTTATEETDYNLSNSEGASSVVNTANCYIVNAAGTYSFPLVYGNAWKNGADNPSAYKSEIEGNNSVLKTFVNHANVPIESPWIAENYTDAARTQQIVPHDAVLVWQDAENLVTPSSIKLTGSSAQDYRITFEVSKSNIQQGNAIIAVRDASSTILWSWHIWVTDFKPLADLKTEDELMQEGSTGIYNHTEIPCDKELENRGGTDNEIVMGVPLGWCYGDYYPGHKVVVEFEQDISGATAQMTVRQQQKVQGNVPFYQWGRKDPMLPSNFAGTGDKTYYPGESYTFNKTGVGKVSIGEAIQNPHVFYSQGNEERRDWCEPGNLLPESGSANNRAIVNLWSTNITQGGIAVDYTPTVKTIYDPSPVGYVVPQNGAFSGFVYGSGSISDGVYNSPHTSNLDYSTYTGSSLRDGWILYCKGMNGKKQYDISGGLIYFPAVTKRVFDNSNNHLLSGALNVSSYLYNKPYDISAGLHMTLTNTYIKPNVGGETGRTSGIAVRPVREKD